MRIPALALSLVLIGTSAATAAPRHSERAPAPSVTNNRAPAPLTTGSIAAPSAPVFGTVVDTSNWGRRSPGLPSPVNPLGYTGE
jgi:hypothetical protein